MDFFKISAQSFLKFNDIEVIAHQLVPLLTR